MKEESKEKEVNQKDIKVAVEKSKDDTEISSKSTETSVAQIKP